MPPKLDDLDSKLRPAGQQLLELCADQGIVMRLNETVRNPIDQARLWRQSRTTEQIKAKVNALRTLGANFLADCIERVGPQHGEHVTNAPPGLSWHQWGEAFDCFWVVDGEAEWSSEVLVQGQNGYRVYARIAEKQLGLTAGGLWKTFKDWPHVQLREEDSPGDLFDITEINAVMKERFAALLD
jgi:peptidoglycan L-alanyl-D-glutamate endopeptidase CwlK